jgi:predicted outer membrane repeat protein
LVLTNSIVKGNSSPASGGGLFNYGQGTVIQSTIASNISAGNGGGIYNHGLLTLRQSTIANNKSAVWGGGIFADAGTTTLVNSTVANNSSGFDGGGIYSNAASVSLYNTTIAANKANTSQSGASGGGVAVNGSASVRLINTILASNLVARSGSPNVSSNDCAVFGGGAITSSGYNLVSTTSGCLYLSNIGDQLGQSALLGPLQKNGGRTQTMALLSGSPAIDAGNSAGCTDESGNLLTVDQRGDPRPHEGDADGDNRCDIGAYEK